MIKAVRRRNVFYWIATSTLVVIACTLIYMTLRRPIHHDNATRNIEPADKVILQSLFLSRKNHYCTSMALRYDHHELLVRSDLHVTIALNLINSQAIVPDLIMEIVQLVKTLGTNRIAVAIFENGSTDQSKTYLGFLKTILEIHKVQHRIFLTNEEQPSGIHRIEYLASIRNRVIDAVVEMEENVDSRIVYLNDVFFCADDVLELLTQSFINDADMVCGTDFDTDEHGLGFYDIWVARDLNGRIFNKRPIDSFVPDPVSRERLKQELPIQVYCCWNGIVALKAKPFIFDGLRFHREHTAWLSADHPSFETLQMQYPNTPLYATCSASEISQLCRDLAMNGYSRRLMVPRVKVAYDWDTYESVKSIAPSKLRLEEERQPMAFSKHEPSSTFCHPLEAAGVRDPDGLAGEEVINPMQ